MKMNTKTHDEHLGRFWVQSAWERYQRPLNEGDLIQVQDMELWIDPFVDAMIVQALDAHQDDVVVLMEDLEAAARRDVEVPGMFEVALYVPVGYHENDKKFDERGN
jgi:hypothetical protein